MKLSEREFQRAKAKYMAALSRNPMDFAARNDLGLLLWNAGKRKDAFNVFVECLQRHPQSATAHANLAFAFLRAGSLKESRMLYEAALRLDPKHPEAKRGLAAVFAQLGTATTDLQQLGGSENALSTIPYRGKGKPVSALLLVSLGIGNVHIEQLLDDRTFAITKLVVELWDATKPLPEANVVFNAIGDAESGADALEIAQRLVADRADVMNAPSRVLRTTREENARRLRDLGGVRTARTERIARSVLAGDGGIQEVASRGLDFPLLLRAPGHHTGHHFTRVEAPGDLAGAAQELPGDEVYAMEYIDFRSPDGKFRKFRVMFVGGQLYPLHLAISQDWKVHYFSAQMADFPEHRAEDEAFLGDMRGFLGEGPAAALDRISKALGLDYAGIDFALDPDGNVIVFESNATMVIVNPDDDERWDYRQLPVRRVAAAARAIFLARATSATQPS